MKFLQVWLICFILVKKLSCETITSNSTIVANRKQNELIESSMDLSANPCEDFYQYACGKWDILHKDAGGKYHDILSLLDYQANKEMARVLNTTNLPNKPKYVIRAYEFYKSCTEVEEYKTLQYLNWLTEYEQLKFPTLWRSRMIREDFDWLRMLAVLRIYGLNGIFIRERVVQRSENPLKFIIELDKPNRDYVPLTRDNLVQIIKSLGVPINTVNIEKLWRELESFELDMKKLDRFPIDLDELYDRNWPRKKIKDIPLPWLKDYIKQILNKTKLNPNMDIHLKKLPYFKVLDELLQKRSKRFLCKYLEIQFLWYLHQQVHTNLTAESCLSNVRSFLPMAVEWLYEQQHPNLELEFPKITNLYDEIRKYFTQMIQETDAEVNIFAKINNMQLKFNNLPHLDTLQTLEKYYDDLNLNVSEFYANHLGLMKINFKATHNLLGRTPQKREFIYLESSNTGASSSPYFIQRSNTVVVPLTLLQQPIYQPDSDNIYKYSTFGFLLARAMFHGFDNTGLIYNNPLLKGLNICTFELTFSSRVEQVSDIAGLHYSYEMFNDSIIDPTDVSFRKLFFLSFAQNFCSTADSHKFVNEHTHGSHRKRITDALTRFPEFSKVFQCNNSHQMYTSFWCLD